MRCCVLIDPFYECIFVVIFCIVLNVGSRNKRKKNAPHQGWMRNSPVARLFGFVPWQDISAFRV